MPYDRTHDVSFVDYHIKDLQSFSEVLQEAANAAFPSLPARYKEVRGLLLSWAEDDLRVWSEITELRSIFRYYYHFDVEEWKIPTKYAQYSLRKRINSWTTLMSEKMLCLLCTTMAVSLPV